VATLNELLEGSGTIDVCSVLEKVKGLDGLVLG